MRKSKKAISIIISLIITFSSLLLLRMQVNWQKELAYTEEQRILININTGIQRAMSSTFEEIAVLGRLFSHDSFSDLVVESFDQTSFSSNFFLESINIWNLYAVDPLLIDEFYLYSTEKTLKYDQEESLFKEINNQVLLENLEERIEKDFDRENFPQPRNPYNFMDDNMLGKEEYYIIMLNPSGSYETLFIKINQDILFNSVLLKLLKKELPDYNIRIYNETYSYTEPYLYDYSQKRPDLVYPLFTGRLWRRQKTALSGEDDLGLFLWTNRAQEEEETLNSSENEEESPFYTLEIYGKENSLKEKINNSMKINLFISSGTILLLLVSYYFLFFLLNRSFLIRKQEKEFVANMSHELRTPIAILKSTSQNLQDGIVSEPFRIKKYGNLMFGESERLTRTVDNILLYSGIEKRNSRIKALTFNPLLICDEIVKRFTVLANKEGIDLVLKNTNVPDSFYGQEEDLKTILENLILNSIKHAGSKEGKKLYIIFEMRRSQPNGLFIQIEDNGSGIPANEQKKVFKPFFRGQKSSKNHVNGSGLGLYLVNKLVELNGGKISLESPVKDITGGKHSGCLFSIYIPEKKQLEGEKG